MRLASASRGPARQGIPMYIEIIADTFANGQPYQVGQILDLAEKVAHELIDARKAIPARKPAAPIQAEPAVSMTASTMPRQKTRKA